MSEWLSPVSGLAGVMVGGLISYWVSERAERRRETRDVRTSARLLEEDLAQVWVQVQRIDDKLHSLPRVADEARVLISSDWLEFPQQPWLELRGTLASVLDSADWEVVKDAYYAASAFQDIAIAEDDVLVLPSDRWDVFRQLKNDVDKGLETLARLGGHPKTAADRHYVELKSPPKGTRD